MSETETPTAKLLAELGELGRVIGLLYQKVEASEQTARNSDRLVQEKLDTWIQANSSILGSNQELLKLIVLNSQELQKSTDSYEKGASLWTSLQQQLTVFEQRMTDWNEVSAAQMAPPVENPETSELLTQLSQSCQQLNLRLDQLGQSKAKPESGDGSQSAIRAKAIRAPAISPNAIASSQIAPSPAKTVADFLSHHPASLLGLAGSGLALVGLGGVALFGIQSFQPEYRVETPRPLTLDEAALLSWAQSPEGQQARELMRWNSGLLDDRSCEQEVERLGVTLELQGKPARSGFCTIWVVPPEQRRFEAG